LWISPLPKRVWRVLQHKKIKKRKKEKEEIVHFNPHIERERKRNCSILSKCGVKILVEFGNLAYGYHTLGSVSTLTNFFFLISKIN
jgi:hypothetical protein